MIESTSMASLLTERWARSTTRGVLTAHAWWLCQCETGACQYHWCSIYRGLERVGSWVPGGSVGRDQLAMAAKVRRHWFNPCRLGSRGHLGANFSLLLYTDLIKKRKPSRYQVYPPAKHAYVSLIINFRIIYGYNITCYWFPLFDPALIVQYSRPIAKK